MVARRTVVCASIIILAMAALVGCAQGYLAPPPPPPTAVAITVQPANQEVPVGRFATFAVTATGTPPIQYQWSKNGSPIPGATSSSYTTPTVAFADTGTTYQVTVSNVVNSVTSNSVTLTAGPRAPAVGDLRYLLWEQANTQSDLTPGVGSGIVSGLSVAYPNSVGTPLIIGTSAACNPNPGGNCYWDYVTNRLPAYVTGLTMHYSSGSYSSLNSDLKTIALSNGVIICLDPEPANYVYAAAWVETQAGGFDYRMETVPPAQLAATVAADGARSRVVTAVALDASTGMADVISYGWQGDTTTVYETTAQIVTPVNIAPTTRAMADEGYIISAFGGNDTNGYALVAMRVEGDTMPRPVLLLVGRATGQYNNPYSVPVTVLVRVEEPEDPPIAVIQIEEQ